VQAILYKPTAVLPGQVIQIPVDQRHQGNPEKIMGNDGNNLKTEVIVLETIAINVGNKGLKKENQRDN